MVKAIGVTCMNSTEIDKNIQNTLITYLEVYHPLMSIVKKINKKGGRVLLVGGAVRDLLLGRPIKDLDIEVHGLSLEDFEAILKKFGGVVFVGKSFGVLRLHGLDVDWALPRTDSVGRKPDVEIDPYMGIKSAFRRRDLTINSMGIDLSTFDLLDPYGGYEHLKKGILHATDEAKFVEDPLRFYRVMQFVGRFGMHPDEQLNEICKKMDVSEVSTERIETEFEKLILKSKYPSLGIRWLKDLSRLAEILPEVASVVGIPQNPAWHPEGEVFEHTMQCLDASAAFDYDDDEQQLMVMYAALCHDLGKSITTQDVGGVFKSIGHSKEGVAISKKLLTRITKKKDLIEAVGKLVRYHMAPSQFIAANAKPAAYKRLAKNLAPHATLQMLAKVALADKQGRNPIKGKPLKKKLPVIDKFLEKAKDAKVEKKPEPPVLLGRDLFDVVEPGPKMGELLKKAYELQIEEGIKDKKELKKKILEDKQ